MQRLSAWFPSQSSMHGVDTSMNIIKPHPLQLHPVLEVLPHPIQEAFSRLAHKKYTVKFFIVSDTHRLFHHGRDCYNRGKESGGAGEGDHMWHLPGALH